MQSSGFLKFILRDSVVLVFFAAAIGFCYNYLSSSGIALSSSFPRKRSEPAVREAPQVDVKEAFSLFSGGAVFLDAREPDEYYVGHIYGSKNVPYEELEDYLAILDSLPRDTIVITYCDGQGCELSINLSRELLKRGFQRVYTFYDGWREWIKLGYPVDVGE